MSLTREEMYHRIRSICGEDIYRQAIAEVTNGFSTLRAFYTVAMRTHEYIASEDNRLKSWGYHASAALRATTQTPLTQPKPCPCYILGSQIIYCPRHLAAPDLLEALAGWMAAAAIKGVYLPEEMREWAASILQGKTRTPAEVTRSIMDQLEGK
jgi:hypothetical protein